MEERIELKRVKKMFKDKPYVPESQKLAHKVQQDVYKSTLCMGKRRTAKGPNPLSCLKKKVMTPAAETKPEAPAAKEPSSSK